MKRSYLLSFALVLAGMGFISSTPSGPVHHKGSLATDSLPNTLLWKISAKKLRKPSYLYGTMHVLCAEDAHLSDSLKAIIRRVDEIYFEINLDDIMGMVQSLKYMRMSDNRKLSDLLDSADYQKVKSYFEKQGSILPFTIIERFKPILISTLIEENGLNCQVTDGMELVIQKQAHQLSKKIRGFETAAFQAGLFDSIPYEMQAKDLVNYIDSIDYYKKTTGELVNVYREQNLERIEELTREGDAAMLNYLDLLLYGRNRRWVDSLRTILPAHPVLIAVGAGHLPGNQGLISLLRKAGFSVTPVKN